MFLGYSELLNTLDTGSTTKLTINNKRLNRQDFDLDVAGVLLQEQHPAKLIPHDEVVLLEFQAVRADGVLEAVALPHEIPQSPSPSTARASRRPALSSTG